ncbi:hypothetical protein [uncultured Friedmanniella sp.]|uniref:hypothetical protein n=1 Tax=uncultured Friedmanniella sp. TaxID=335381 RepID=UPI0035CC8ECE
MVALLVRLKLTLLRNSLRRSVWRTIGLVLAALYGVGIVVAALAGMVGLRYTSTALTADVTVVAFSGLSFGWLVLSLLVFGVDETVDPAKFALLPVRARDLLPGLLVAALVGVPGVASVLVGLGLVLAWGRGVLLVAAALVAVVLGVPTCVLLARTATSAFAASLSSRRFRDLAFVAFALVGAVFALGGQAVGRLAGLGPERLRGALATAATVAAWTPFGWAWAIPADVSRSRWWTAGTHLVLAVALVAVLALAWAYFLGRRLVEPTQGEGSASRVRRHGWAERLYPQTPAGGVALRTLRYWRRDPRYLAALAGFLMAPVVIVVVTRSQESGGAGVAVLAPSLLALFIGTGVAADLSYDGSAVWTHVTAGLDGASDRLGRTLSALTVYVPVLVVLEGVALAVTGGWSLLPASVALMAALGLGGLGVGCLVGTLWQWPAPEPGASLFAKGGGGGLPALLSFSVTTSAAVLVALPTVALVVGSFWVPWLGWIAVPVGLANGLVVLWQGVVRGGRMLDRRWPEVMRAVSERAG